MNVEELGAAVRRYRWTAISVAAAVLVVSAIGLFLWPTRYVSTTQLMVSIEGSTTADAYQNDEVVTGRVNSYIGLLTSSVVAQRVVDELGLPLSAADLAGRINATNVPPRTAIIDVAVTDDSPAGAQRLAATVARQFIGYTEALETPTGEDGQKVHTTIVTEPSEPQARVAERIVLGLLAAVAAALLAAVAVWIRSRTDPIIHSVDQAETATGATMLGCVAPDGDLRDYRRLRTRLRSMIDSSRDDDRGSVLVVAPVTDDIDTRVLAANLSRALDVAGEQAVVLDAYSSRFTAETEPDAPTEESPETPSADGWVDEPTKKVLADVDELRARYGHVLVAAPPMLATATASTLADRADGVVLVVSPGVTRRRDVARAVADLRATGAPPIGTVLWRSRPVDDGAVRADGGGEPSMAKGIDDGGGEPSMARGI